MYLGICSFYGVRDFLVFSFIDGVSFYFNYLSFMCRYEYVIFLRFLEF